MKSILENILLILFLFSADALSQTWSTPSTNPVNGTTTALWSVSLYSSNGIAVGDAGTILTTSDSGANWTSRTSGVSVTLNAVSMYSTNGIAVGESGTVLSTTNSGTSWTVRSIGATLSLMGVALYSNNGIIVGAGGQIYRTTNAGANWTTVQAYNVSLYTLYAVALYSTNGIAVGSSGTILTTSNSGSSWTDKTSVSGTTNWLSGVSLYSSSGVACGESGIILKTTDAGASWNSQTSNTTSWLVGISLTDANNGTIARDAGGILRTINGGSTWTTQTNGTLYALNGISFSGSDVGVAVGYDGVIIRTTNGSLPVELISFNANVGANSVLLNWETATEVNNYGFEIHRLALNNWEKIGFVNGNGNSNSLKKYFYNDFSMPSGKVQYRLKQIDFDGQFDYSDVITVDVSHPSNFVLHQNYPNPFNPITTMKFTIPFVETQHAASQLVTLKVYNVLGKEIATLVNEAKSPGNYEIIFNVETLHATSLSSGVYFYTIKAGNFLETKKMALMK